MGIGTSQGAFYEDSFHQAAAQWDPKYDTNEIGVDEDNPANNDKNTMYPLDVQMYRSMPNQMQEQVGMKSQMPFPDNNNPNTDFTNRFGNLPPSGVLNDLKKPTDPSPPLLRRIANVTNTPGEIMDGLEGARAYPSGFSKPESIKSAALRNADNGEVFTGQTHGHAFDKLMDKYPSETNFGKIDQGFTTTHGRFVSREEAFGIAQDAKQFINKGVPPVKAFGLLSEDIQ